MAKLQVAIDLLKIEDAIALQSLEHHLLKVKAYLELEK